MCIISVMTFALRHRWLIAFVSAAMLGAGVALGLGLWPSDDEALGLPSRWPPFSMMYREDQFGEGGGTQYNLFSFTFANVRDWRLELKESTVDPGQVGAYQSFQDDTYTHYNPTVPHAPETEMVSPPQLVAPNDWLFPGKMEAQAEGGQWKEADIGSVEVRRFAQTLVEPCQTDSPAPLPPPCAGGRAAYEVVTQMDYDKDLGIPVGVSVYTNGRLTRTIRVLELKVSP
jgi:hypothetical protein